MTAPNTLTRNFRRWLVPMVVSLCVATALAESALTGDFDAANQLYEKGKFTEAASAYQALISSNHVSAALYFNLGNALYKAGGTGRALAAYREAERLAPRDPDIRANLQFIRAQVQGVSAPPGHWSRVIGLLTVNEWTWLATLAFWCWVGTLIVLQIRPAWKVSLRSLVWSSAAATAVLAVLLFSALTAASTPMAVVAVPEAAIRNGPIQESPTAFTAHDGAELKILDRKDGWLQVDAGGRFGWLSRDQAVVFPAHK